MKKLVVLAAAMALCLNVLSGCSSAPSPTEVTDTFLNAVKSQDMETMQNNYAEGTFDFGQIASSEASEEGAQLSEEATNTLTSKLLEFDYEISNEQINENTATVDVSITTYPFGDAFSSFVSDYLSQGFAAALNGASDEEMGELGSSILTQKLNGMEKSYTGTATLSLTKVDDQWKVDTIADDSDFVNVLSGGLLDTANTINEVYGGEQQTLRLIVTEC